MGFHDKMPPRFSILFAITKRTFKVEFAKKLKKHLTFYKVMRK